jgi:hypothetical protein
MSKTATLKGKISLDDSEFSKVMRRATDRLKKFGSDSAEAVGKWSKRGFLALASGATAAGGGMLYAAKAAADLGGQLSDASAVTGVTTGKMLVLQQAFANAGMSSEGAAGTIARLQAAIGKSGMMSEEAEDQVAELTERIRVLQRMGGKGAQIAGLREQIAELKTEGKGVQKAFQRMGLNQSALARMDGAGQIMAVVNALDRMGSHTDKIAALRMLRLPPDLMVLAKDSNAFRDANKMLGGLVGNMGKFAGKFDRISDIINAKPGIMIRQLGAGFLKALADNPMVKAGLKYIEELDLSGLGEKIGEYVAAAIDFANATIQDGKLLDTVKSMLKIGFSYAMEYFLTGMAGVLSVVGGAFKTIFSGKGAEFVSGFTEALVGAMTIIGHEFSKQVQLAIFDIDQALANSTLGRLWGGIKDVGTTISGAMQMFSGGATTGLVNLASGGTARGGLAEWGWQSAQQGYERYGRGLRNLLYGRPEQDPDITAQKRAAIANDQTIDWLGGVSYQKLAAESTQKLGDSVVSLADVLSQFPSKVSETWGQLNMDRISGPLSQERKQQVDAAMQTMFSPAQREAAERFIRAGQGNGGQMTYDEFLNRTYIGPQGIMYPGAGGNRGGRPDLNQRGSKAQGELGDTGPKLVEGLEKVAALLKQNLTTMQMA